MYLLLLHLLLVDTKRAVRLVWADNFLMQVPRLHLIEALVATIDVCDLQKMLLLVVGVLDRGDQVITCILKLDEVSSDSTFLDLHASLVLWRTIVLNYR